MDETATGLSPIPPVSSMSLRSPGDASIITLGLFLFCLFILFHNLGAAALFEPDEGRNAEIAREILLTKDWVTPHNNFMPVLDKPFFSYWLIALSYKLFGTSEWSARLPSALAGLGSLVVIYLFTRSLLGIWEALWGTLVLATSVEFFLLSRIVILDMALSFFITLSLFSFYCGLHTDDKAKGRIFCFLMFVMMGGATLVKGPIGFILPGMVISAYLLLARKWALVRKMTMDIVLGSLLFFLIVAPWYTWVEVRNPGYLHYFLWEEHFIRFLTPHFHRSEPWYYFFGVLAAGFIPWTPLIPVVINKLRKRSTDDTHLFLLIWTVLPFVFFSVSDSKLPHYILPIFPPLSILTGETVVRIFEDPSRRRIYLLSLPWLAGISPILFFALGFIWPSILPRAIRQPITQMPDLVLTSGAAILMSSIAMGMAVWMGRLKRRGSFYFSCCASLVIIFAFIGKITIAVSSTRSARELAQKSAPLITPRDQIVLYNNYISSLPFYLHVSRPIWVVWSGAKSNIMGSFYVAEKRPQPATGYGKVLFTFDEFDEQWKKSKGRLFVFVEEKNLFRLGQPGGPFPAALLKVGEDVLAANR